MRLSRLSYRSLLRLDIPYLPNLPPLTHVDPVRFNHIRRLLDDLELLFRVWREFVAFAIDLEGPVLNLAEDVDFFGRIDGFPKVLENELILVVILELSSLRWSMARGQAIQLISLRGEDMIKRDDGSDYME